MLDSKSFEGIIGKTVKIRYWVGNHQRIAATSGRVIEVTDTSVEIKNKPMSFPGFGAPLPTSTVISKSKIETLTIK